MLGTCAVGEGQAVLLDVVLGDAQRVGGEADGLGAEVARGEGHRVAAHHRGAARERSDALRDARGVAGDHGHVLGRHAELVRRHLRERGLEPLPLGAEPGEHGDAPGRVHARRRALERPDTGELHVAGDADAATPPRGAPAGPRASQPLPAGHLERAPQHGGEVAAVQDHGAGVPVVGQPHVVGHGLGRHQVGQAHRGAVAAGLARHQVEHALDHEHRLRLPGATVRRDGHAVRVDAVEDHSTAGMRYGPVSIDAVRSGTTSPRGV